MRRALVVFTRAPVLGRVKTRLAKELGDDRALEIHKELAERTVSEARKVTNTAVTVAFTPNDRQDAIREWLGDDLAYEPQRGGDLGARMANAIQARISSGAERIAVIGTDAPDLRAGHIDEAFGALDGADVAIGPASDGGYYLIAVKARHPALFAGIAWGSADTLRQTLAAAREAKLRVHVLDILSDVDTPDDWRSWMQRSGRVPL